MKDKYFCRACRGLRNHKQLHEVKRKGGDDESDFQWIHNFLIIECLGCENISFLEVYGNTDMVNYNHQGEMDYYNDETIYPYYLEKNELGHSSLIPASIKSIYDETIASFKSGPGILTAGGLRAIIEATCNHLKIKKTNLADRIDLLNKGGYLTVNESKRLHSIRFLGNDALHEMEKPKKEQLYLLLDIVNHLLSNLFINDRKMKGNVDTIIDKYDEFLRLIQNKIGDDMINREYSIDHIIGKSKRLVPAATYKEFLDRFKTEIEKGLHDYIATREYNGEAMFKILKMPDFYLDW